MIQNLTLLDIDMPQADSFEVFGVNEEDVQLDMMKLRLAAISQIEKEKRRWNLYPKCSTCQKAKKWLDENKIEYTERHIVNDNPTYEELKKWYEKSGLPLKRFFNTSGMLYKEMKLKDRLPEMSEDEQLKLLATNGMLVRRPLLVTEDKMLVGFKEAERVIE